MISSSFKWTALASAVLGVLDQEHHEKGDDRRRRINNELPGIGEMKGGTGEDPYQDDQHGSGKGPGTAKDDGRTTCEDAKRVADNAKKVPFLFLFHQLFDLRLPHDAIFISNVSLKVRA